jgi:hypothetical protein
VNNYITRFTLTSVTGKPRFNTEKGDRVSATSFDWSYSFGDGSRIVGKFEGKFDRERKRLFDPTTITADYLDTDGKTILVSWQNSDFVNFETTLDGSETLIVASNDSFLVNSMCLVSSSSRTCAQVTDVGTQIVAEPFNSNVWSIAPQTVPVSVEEAETGMGLDLELSPFFPFVSVNLDLWESNPRQTYRWTFYPCFPFHPFIPLVKTPPSSERLLAKFGSL